MSKSRIASTFWAGAPILTLLALTVVAMRDRTTASGSGGGGGSGGGASDGAEDAAESKMKAQPPARSWWELAKRVVARMGDDNLTLIAAGVSFYALLSIFPALSVFVSIYATFADVNSIQKTIADVSAFVPEEASKLLFDTLKSFIEKPASTIGLALLTSVALGLWTARAGVSSMMTGLNIAGGVKEKRSFIVQQLVALGLTTGSIVFAAAAIFTLALLPALIKLLAVDESISTWLLYLRWPLLAVGVGLGVAALYRWAPSWNDASWRWLTPGAAMATVLWLAGSALFSIYVSRLGSYDATYGSLGAVIVLLLWFWLSALVVMLGATVDAELKVRDEHGLEPTPQEVA